MIIKLSPQRRDDTLKVSKRSDVLTINGERFDFRPVTEGATLPAAAISCPWIAGDVTRVGGELIVPLILPLGPDASEAAMHPLDMISPADGNLELPT
ncbi:MULTISPECIES: hypothetical protein [unclassified Pseudomonas]|uniref:hypothetical protein n=1 Tax=unclassified Pseudomonas TaxID=196821 RepID=UPI00131CD319|nr:MULTISPECIES: hypothetical protein [unclassified Pseudomonas]